MSFSDPSQFSFAGLVAFFVLAVLRGWIVPRKQLDDVRADRDARLTEIQRAADATVATVVHTEGERVNDKQQQLTEALLQSEKWRTAYMETDKIVVALLGQTAEMNELARTANHFLTALPRPQEEDAKP